MVRTPQNPSRISREEFAVAGVRLRAIQAAISRAAEIMGANDELDVIYAASLERGLKSLEAVEPEIRRALDIYELRMSDPNAAPKKSVPSIPHMRRASDIAAERPDDSKVAEDAVRDLKRAVARDNAKQPPAKSGRKKKSG